MKKTLWILVFFLCAISIVLLTYGEAPFVSTLLEIPFSFHPSLNTWNPILHERIPRLIILISSGASLAVAGAVMQSVLCNPLASPSVLGMSTGGAFFVLIVFLLGLQNIFFLIPIGAVLGSISALFLVFFIARYSGNKTTMLILIGISISLVLASIQGCILYAIRENWHLVQIITEWSAGTTYDRTWTHVHMQLPLAIVGLTGVFYYINAMNLLATGEDTAKALGIDVEKVRFLLFLFVAFLTGGVTAAVGIVPFFGLVIPHIIRRISGPNHQKLIPLSALTGSCVFCCLDFILRYFKMYFLSIGNLSAILGGIFFLILLFSQRKKTSLA